MFDESYYRGIWPDQGVHRHDFDESHVQRILSLFGRGVKLLDVGCGCGIVVKLLREYGVEAWGCDISAYAIANSCAPQYCIQASVCGLPYPDKFFDVVISNGMLEYVAEEDVPKAIAELKRVGREQWHQIDTEECQNRPEFQIITLKSRAWWMEKFNGEGVI